MKAVQKPVAKTTVKKTSAAKHVAKAAGPQKTKHVAAVKHQPPAKGAARVQPVLPRV